MSSLARRIESALSGGVGGVGGLLGFLILVVIAFSLTAPQFLTFANLNSMAFQLPDIGLLTLAMLMPDRLSGGINLAINLYRRT